MTSSLPCRRTSLQFSQIRLTLVRTFMTSLPRRGQAQPERQSPHVPGSRLSAEPRLRAWVPLMRDRGIFLSSRGRRARQEEEEKTTRRAGSVSARRRRPHAKTPSRKEPKRNQEGRKAGKEPERERPLCLSHSLCSFPGFLPSCFPWVLLCGLAALREVFFRFWSLTPPA